MEMTRRLLGLFLLLLHLLFSAHKTEGKDCHDSNQTRPSGHHPRPFGVTQKIGNRLGQVIAGKKSSRIFQSYQNCIAHNGLNGVGTGSALAFLYHSEAKPVSEGTSSLSRGYL
jgi:hypothetical protein